MAIQGSLQDMDLPALLETIAQTSQTAYIRVQHRDRQVRMFVEGRQLHHIELITREGLADKRLSSEEIFYKLLTWREGKFSIERNVQLPEKIIDVNWQFLLMEGLRKLDEDTANVAVGQTNDESLSDMLENLSDADAATIRELIAQQENNNMADINATLNEIMQINGAIAAAVVDWESGLTLGTAGSGFNIDLAAAGNTNVVRSKLSVMKDLQIEGTIEDILITLTNQYHLIRLLSGNNQLFIYLALSKSSANLGLARHRLATIEKNLTI